MDSTVAVGSLDGRASTGGLGLGAALSAVDPGLSVALRDAVPLAAASAEAAQSDADREAVDSAAALVAASTAAAAHTVAAASTVAAAHTAEAAPAEAAPAVVTGKLGDSPS